MLDLSRRSHREKFSEIIDKQLDSMNIESEIDYLIQYLSKEGIEQLDINLICILNKARKKIEGPQSNMLYSIEKVKRKAIKQY